RRLVVPARLRLDPAPLDREAIRVQAEGAQEIEILLVPLPVKTGRAGSIPVPDGAGQLLPVPPVVLVVAAFDLMRGGAGAPEELPHVFGIIGIPRAHGQRESAI